MLALLLACAGPDTAEETGDPWVTDTDTDTTCDPAVGSVAHPDFKTAVVADPVVVVPAELDPDADLDPAFSHLVYEPEERSRERLLVFLPGEDLGPDSFTALMKIGTAGGFRTVGLAWPSTQSPGALCAGDGACIEAVEQELLYGADVSAEAGVDEADSILGRLLTLVRTMAAAAPDAGWDEYLDDEGLAYENLVVAGWSAGANAAAYLGKDLALGGGVYFAGGCDLAVDGGEIVPADWCAATRLTTPDKMYGMLHTADQYDALVAGFDALTLDDYGDFADADITEPRYCTATHQLHTTLPDQAGVDDFHAAVGVDGHVAADGLGVPLNANDYWYMLTMGDR